MKNFIRGIYKCFSIVVISMIFSLVFINRFNEVTVTASGETTLVELIERYGEESVIVENGISLNVGQVYSFSNREMYGENVKWSITNNSVINIVNEEIKGISPGTAFVIGQEQNNFHIIEISVSSTNNPKRITNVMNNYNNVFYKVFIDAGHGGADPGAIKNGVREADINLSIALKVERKLKAMGIDIMMSRSSDVFVDLKARSRLSNEYGADVFVSIHQNSSTNSSVRGVETYYHETKADHEKLASKIQSELIKNTGAINRGVRTQDFSVNRETIAPSTLVECGYISNSYEAALLRTDDYQERIANSIVNGIYSYLEEYAGKYQWKIENENRYYVNLLTGQRKTGWVDIDKVRYYFNDEGIMQTGLLDYNGRKYYLNDSGAMHIGWMSIDGNWYYFNYLGVMQTKWVTLPDNNLYYFGNDGVVQTGWLNLDDKKYYFDSSGVMKTGWLKYNNQWYYLNGLGIMQTKWATLPDNNLYYFGDDGVVQTGWINLDGKKYYLDSSGVRKTGWVKYHDQWYYLNSLGIMQTNWSILPDNHMYYFGSEGVQQTGWLSLDGKKYYLDSSGVMKTGWVNYDNQRFYSNSSGVIQTDWQYINNKWYYFENNGAMRTGWLLINKYWYYLDATGVMRTGWVNLAGNWYYFYEGGDMKVGWLSYNGNKYYFDSSGVMKTGWFTIEGSTYYFYNDGHRASNTVIDGRRINSNGVAY